LKTDINDDYLTCLMILARSTRSNAWLLGWPPAAFNGPA